MRAMSGNKQQKSHHFFLLHARWKKKSSQEWDTLGLRIPSLHGRQQCGNSSVQFIHYYMEFPTLTLFHGNMTTVFVFEINVENSSGQTF